MLPWVSYKGDIRITVIQLLLGLIAKQCLAYGSWWCLSVCLFCLSVCPSTFWLTSAFKFVLGQINQYRRDTLHGNRPWWDLLNCDLSLRPWPWLFLFKVTLQFWLTSAFKFLVKLISTDLIPCMGIDLDEISWTATFPCDPDLHFFRSRSLNNFG